MLKYLVILLDNASISYCHYDTAVKESQLIPIDIFKKGILFAMKNNLKIQYILPHYDIPQNYVELMNSMFHDNIGPLGVTIPVSVIVFNGLQEIDAKILDSSKQYVIRIKVNDFIEHHKTIMKLFENGISLNIVFIDVESFSEEQIQVYREILSKLTKCIESSIMSGNNIHTNLITDRIALDYMNNCGAGETSITLAPNGKFYPCPAFYYDNNNYYTIGDIDRGLNIKNKNLYKLEYAPLCKRCDAYHCKRCIWLNKKLTYEINTPSRQQCVMSHLEREASRLLLENFHKHNILLEKKIKTINYIDPFDNYK